jgi:ribosomal protein S18 acetylase RimI-like enzyme
VYLQDESTVTDRCRLTNVEGSSGYVRRMRLDDVAGAALLHRIAFPDYFLTHMGLGFLERFYSEFVDRSMNYGFVAICDEKVIGSVVGTVDSGTLFSQFYRRHFLSLALVLAGRVIVDPYIRRNLVSRMAHVRQALSSRFARRRRTSPAIDPPAENQVPARLLSIGVHPEKRGSGLAEQLVDRYCEALWQDGQERVGLSVRSENLRAIAFYERTGWQRAGASAASVQYTRSTRSRSTGGGTS